MLDVHPNRMQWALLLAIALTVDLVDRSAFFLLNFWPSVSDNIKG